MDFFGKSSTKSVLCHFQICSTDFRRSQRINLKLCMGGVNIYHLLTIVQCGSTGLITGLAFWRRNDFNFSERTSCRKPQPLLPVLTVPFWSSLFKKNGPLCAAFFCFFLSKRTTECNWLDFNQLTVVNLNTR